MCRHSAELFAERVHNDSIANPFGRFSPEPFRRELQAYLNLYGVPSSLHESIRRIFFDGLNFYVLRPAASDDSENRGGRKSSQNHIPFHIKIFFRLYIYIIYPQYPFVRTHRALPISEDEKSSATQMYGFVVDNQKIIRIFAAPKIGELNINKRFIIIYANNSTVSSQRTRGYRREE